MLSLDLYDTSRPDQKQYRQTINGATKLPLNCTTKLKPVLHDGFPHIPEMADSAVSLSLSLSPACVKCLDIVVLLAF